MYIIENFKELEGKSIRSIAGGTEISIVTSDGGICSFNGNIRPLPEWRVKDYLINYSDFAGHLGFTREQVEQSFPEEYKKYLKERQERKLMESNRIYGAAKKFIEDSGEEIEEKYERLKDARELVMKYEGDDK